MASFDVVTFDPNETVPPPDSEKAPSILRLAPGEKISVPVWTTLTGPELVVAVVSEKAKFVPVREIPLRAFVSKAPLKVDVPDPAVCTIKPELIPLLTTRSSTLEIVTDDSLTVSPRDPSNEISPT